MRRCPKCNSPNWDYANVGIPKALACLNCGNLYGDNRMNESEFESKFESGDLDCEFAMFISERYDAWDKHCLLYTSPSPRDGATSRMPSSA